MSRRSAALLSVNSVLGPESSPTSAMPLQVTSTMAAKLVAHATVAIFVGPMSASHWKNTFAPKSYFSKTLGPPMLESSDEYDLALFLHAGEHGSAVSR